MAGLVYATAGEMPRKVPAQALIALAILSLIALLGSYDRYLVGILAEDIKRDLAISDSAVGLLTGLGFALVYSLMSVPIARFSDRGHRVATLGVSILVWSAMTALCGLAPAFLPLLLARLGVGLGEAGCIPTTHAIISEYFPQRWRATALSATVVTTGFGVMLANLGGGWIADHLGWRTAFLVGALPGPVLAYLLWSHVREPVVRTHQRTAATMPLWPALRQLAGVRTLRLLCIGSALASISSYATMAWFPAFLMRRYDLSAAEAGAGYGTLMGLSMIVAILLGGLLGDHLLKKDARLPIWQLAIGYMTALPLTLAFLFAGSLTGSLIVTVPMTLAAMAGSTVAYALVQELAGPGLRATGAALFLLCSNLVGVGLGPLAVGALSDLLARTDPASSLQHALAVTALFYAIGGAMIAAGAASVKADMVRAKQSDVPARD